MKVKIVLFSTYYLLLQTYETNGGGVPREVGVSGKPLDDQNHTRDDRRQEQRSRPIGGGNMPPPKDPPQILTLVEDFEGLSREMRGLQRIHDRDYQKVENMILELQNELKSMKEEMYYLSDDVTYKMKKMEEKVNHFEKMIEDLKETKAKNGEGSYANLIHDITSRMGEIEQRLTHLEENCKRD